MREDYSADGDAWSSFPHEHARSRAYRWGEDAIAGWCDRYQLLVLAPAFWNERDPILKERLFGLVPSEGNHGEDVKECYFHLDATPTHSYVKLLYKYPQRAFPYRELVEENRRRAGGGPEYELLDTGVFDDDRYFDIVVEYAKAGTEDTVLRITATNRGPDAAPLHLLAQLWFRNTWSWWAREKPRPRIDAGPGGPAFASLVADDAGAEPLQNLPFRYLLGPRRLYGPAGAESLFADNETNAPRVRGPGAESRSAYPKDAFHRHVVDGEAGAVNPARTGTKAALHYRFEVPAGGSATLRLRLTDRELADPLGGVDAIVARRISEADEFYAQVQPPKATDDERAVQRQAFAGMLWTKQIYLFDVERWLDGDEPAWPPPESHRHVRNVHWRHLNSMRVMSMPDAWEYPWFAAWDLAFHCTTLALVDPGYAKESLWVLLFEQFQHPSGQLPAYEWEFGDLNPPVHAWAVWRVYNMDRIRAGKPDTAFLERCFHKLLINFAWWVNKVDREGNNVFEGGFLGLDNITILDRSEPLPEGTVLEQSDATGWMGMFCLNLMRIALELARTNPVYEGLATKFFEHYMYVGAAMKRMGGRRYALWDTEDGFFYDVLRHADGSFEKFRVRSLVGLVPLYAIERLEARWTAPFTEFRESTDWFVRNMADVAKDARVRIERDGETVDVLSIVDEEQLRGLLRRLLDPAEFMSPYGMRSLSRYHLDHPFTLGDRVLRYEPGESESKLKGGNSNWRGPVWFPTGFLMIESLRKLGTAYGPDLTVPANGPNSPAVPLREVARDLAERMIRLFLKDADGRRPLHGAREVFRSDPHWCDLVLFHEYFDGDTGEGLGASHQTGWTGLVASLIDEWRR